MLRNNFKIFSYLLLTVFLTLGLSISFQSLLAAWTAPLANPPTCVAGNPGCDEPVNKGIFMQYKRGPLYVNGDNNAIGFTALGKVGIGTINPQSLTHLRDANTSPTGSQLIIEANSAWGAMTYSGIEFRTNATSGGVGSSGRIVSSYPTVNYTDATMTFQTIGNGPIFVDTMSLRGGNVGIGTINPQSLTHLRDANTSPTGSQLIIEANSAWGAMTYSGIEFRTNATSGGVGSSGRIVSSYPTVNYTDATMTFQTIGNGPIFVDTMSLRGGNVGIGTAAPFGKLQVQDGAVTFSGTIGATPISGAGARLMWVPANRAFRAGAVDGTQWDNTKIGLYSVAMGYNTTASGMISTALGGSTVASGNWSTALGANTIASSFISLALGRFNVGGGTADSWVATDPIFEIGIGVDNFNKANALTVLKNGNVGIGTTGPVNKLDVSGGMTIGSYAGVRIAPDSGLIISGNVGIGTTTPLSKLAVSGGASIGANYNIAAPTNGMIIQGNVGIGTVSPGAKLEVAGQIKITSGAPGAGKVLTSDASGLASWVALVSSQWTTSGSNIYYNTGNVGIGTANPGEKLEVNGKIKFTASNGITITTENDQGGFKIGSSAATNGAGFRMLPFGNNIYFQNTNSAGSITFSGLNGVNLAGNVIFRTTGNVGIGDTAPGAKLSVVGNAAIGYASGQTAPANGLIISGNVGIGTNNPGTYKLSVLGNALITGNLKVTGTIDFAGADVAEEFSTPEKYDAGTVLVMGDNGYRSAKISSRVYDSTVIGVVSDNPAIVMGKAAGENKAIVAIAGVIKVKVTASNGKIMKGDLLTTSATAGYAMKATENKLGTIIGKALEDLEGNRGEIMTLINLQ